MSGERLRSKLTKILPTDGKRSTALDCLTLMRFSSITTSSPVVYQPKLFVIAQGAKEIVAGSKPMRFDCFHYLLSTIPMPIQGRVTESSEAEPFLAMNIALEMSTVRELLQQMDAEECASEVLASDLNSGVQIHPLDDSLSDVLVRLLDALESDESARILGQMAIKEIYYRLLRGPERMMLQAFAQQDRHSCRIARVLDFIQANLNQTLSVGELADMANMSASSFHEHFKNVTDTSPQQYVKSMRLDMARKRLVEEDITVSEAAYQVGYSSLSQFSREFKRLFGVSPTQAVAPAGGFAGL